jgi:periplasmic protein TonB
MVMKTKRNFRALANLKLIGGLLVIATTLVAPSSCSKNKTTSDQVFTIVDELPVFKDGDRGLLDFIKYNCVYPEDAKKNNITGRVIVKFIVEKDGSVSKAEILQSVYPSLDAEAIRVVSSLPKFEKPAKQAGETVRVNYMVPITFALK